MSDNECSINSTKVSDRNSYDKITEEEQELSSIVTETFAGNANDGSDRTESKQTETYDQIDSKENIIIICSLCGSRIPEGSDAAMLLSATADEAAVTDRPSVNHGDEHDSLASASEDVDGQRSP